MHRHVRLAPALLLVLALSGCMRNYSPNTYSAAAAQQANKATQGVVVGFREVMISADGTVGTVTGGAAGGVLGAQTPGSGVTTALGTIGGTLLGGLIGTGVEHAAGDTRAFEYLVKQTDGSLVSVTQKDEAPLPVGEKVLVIAGNQARIVKDYSVPVEPPAAAVPKEPPAAAPAAAANEPPTEAKEPPAAQAAGSAPPPASEAAGSASAPAAISRPVQLLPQAPAPAAPPVEEAPLPEPPAAGDGPAEVKPAE